jgi:hypothetical protein
MSSVKWSEVCLHSLAADTAEGPQPSNRAPGRGVVKKPQAAKRGAEAVGGVWSSTMHGQAGAVLSRWACRRRECRITRAIAVCGRGVSFAKEGIVNTPLKGAGQAPVLRRHNDAHKKENGTRCRAPKICGVNS